MTISPAATERNALGSESASMGTGGWMQRSLNHAAEGHSDLQICESSNAIVRGEYLRLSRDFARDLDQLWQCATEHRAAGLPKLEVKISIESE